MILPMDMNSSWDQHMPRLIGVPLHHSSSTGWMSSTPALLSWFLTHPPPLTFPAITSPAWIIMHAFTGALAGAASRAPTSATAPASAAELKFLLDYMSLGQQYSQHFASAEGRSRIATAGPAQTKHVADILQQAASSQVFPALIVSCLQPVMGQEGLVPILCSPVLADALWARLAGCCQYLFHNHHQQQQQQQQQQQRGGSSSSSSSSSRARGSKQHGRTNKKGSSSGSGTEGSWLDVEVPRADHQLLPVPGGQLAVTTQGKFWECVDASSSNNRQSIASSSSSSGDSSARNMLISLSSSNSSSSSSKGLEGLGISSSSKGLEGLGISSSSSSANSSSKSGTRRPAITAPHLQMLLELIVLSAAEGERYQRPENFLQILNLFLMAARVASKEERGAFLAARGKLLLQVLMLLGKAVDRGVVKDLRMAVSYVLAICLEDRGLSGALHGQPSKCCQLTRCAHCLGCHCDHHSHDMAQPV